MNLVEKMHAKVEKGELCFGTHCSHTELEFYEMCGLIGYDYVWIDAEHASMTFPMLKNAIIATNAGGAGMLSALGFEFLDADGDPLPLGAAGLENLHTITNENIPPELSECTFRVACDVTNPLCGERGCSAVFGPQKGATPETVALMDGWLKRYAEISKNLSPSADPTREGAGAAGGLGFAFSAFLNAELQSGVSIILEETRLEDYIKDADLVVTGEGRLDGQTVMGKAPIGVARLAKKHQKPVIAFSGCVTEEAEVCNAHGIDAFFPILRGVVTLDEALETENARRNLTATAYQVFRLLDLRR